MIQKSYRLDIEKTYSNDSIELLFRLGVFYSTTKSIQSYKCVDFVA